MIKIDRSRWAKFAYIISIVAVLGVANGHEARADRTVNLDEDFVDAIVAEEADNQALNVADTSKEAQNDDSNILTKGTVVKEKKFTNGNIVTLIIF